MSSQTSFYPKILKLAWPIITSHMGHMMAAVADSVMAGQLGKFPLAAIGFSNSIYGIFVLFGIGLATGITPLVAKAHSQGDEDEKQSLFKHGLILCAAAGVILMALMLCIVPFMQFMKQDPAVIEEAIPYYILLSVSTLFSLVFFHYKQFGEGLELVKTTTIVLVLGNALNVGLNFVFIHGYFGLPAMGSMGIGLATLIARIFMLVGIVYGFSRTGMIHYMRGYRYVKYQVGKLRDLLNECLPIAFQFIIEMGTFSIGAIMSGWFGATSNASHQIAINIASITYLIAAGLGSATTIVCGQFFGKKDVDSLKKTTIASVKLVIGMMSVTALIMIMGNYFLPGLYNSDPDVIELSAQLLVIAAIFQLFDGLQVVGLGVLRGINDLKTPTQIAVFAYLIVTIPLCYILSTVFDMKAVGVWIGFLAGLAISATLIFWRIRNRFELMQRSE